MTVKTSEMLPRRGFLLLAAALPASGIARAQPYPERPVRLIAPAVPGDVSDLFARMYGEWLGQQLDQPFIIENRPGAGGNIATEAVVRAPPDGYTLLWVTSANAWNATLYTKLNFNFIRDIAPAASSHRGYGVLVVHPSFPARTLPEFTAYAKSNPGKINMASGGVGSGAHLWGELFKMMAGVDMLHVPYRGGRPALADLLAGQVQVMFDAAPACRSSAGAPAIGAFSSSSPRIGRPGLSRRSQVQLSVLSTGPIGVSRPRSYAACRPSLAGSSSIAAKTKFSGCSGTRSPHLTPRS